MLEMSRMTPSAAPASSVTSGVLRFMWGPTHLEARRVQYCAEVSEFSLTPDATWRATPGRRFPGQADGGPSERADSWLPLCRYVRVPIYRGRIPACYITVPAQECNKFLPCPPGAAA